MKDSGWERDNNQCCHQIDRMKRRYDIMVEQDKKSGGCLYVEVLRRELNECFGALKDVTPDKVYSCRKGMLSGAALVAESDESNSNSNNSTEDAEAGTSAVQPSSSKEKKIPKSKEFCPNKFIYCSQLCFYCYIYIFCTVHMNDIEIVKLLKHNNFFFTFTAGRQPVVSLIESALGRCTADWKEQNSEMNKKLDLMLDLQRQRLLLDQQRLEFEREMAGLGKFKSTAVDPKTTKTRKRKKGKNQFKLFKLFGLCKHTASHVLYFLLPEPSYVPILPLQ